LTGGNPGFSEDGNASSLGGKGIKVGGNKLDRKRLRHGTLHGWIWERGG
jgi:hypothetical protein